MNAKLTVMALLMVAGFGSTTQAASEATDTKNQEIVMKSKVSGDTIRFQAATIGEVEAEFRAARVTLPAWMKECKDPARANFTNVELELELGFLIETLQESGQTQLSVSQQELVSSIPLCPSYLVKLKTVALLLQHYQLVEEGKRAGKVASSRR